MDIFRTDGSSRPQPTEAGSAGTPKLVIADEAGLSEMTIGTGVASEVKMLINAPPDERSADISPAIDQSTGRVVFSRTTAETVDLYLLEGKGLDPQRLTQTPEIRETGATWHPAGREVAFESTDALGRTSVQSLDISSGEQMQMSRKGLIAFNPVWRNSGDSLIYAGRDRASGETDLYEVTRTGDESTAVATPGQDEFSPAISPFDGSLLYLAREHKSEALPSEQVTRLYVEGAQVTGLPSANYIAAAWIARDTVGLVKMTEPGKIYAFQLGGTPDLQVIYEGRGVASFDVTMED